MPNVIQKIIYILSTIVPLIITFAITLALKNSLFYGISISFGAVAIFILILFALSFSYGKKHLAPITINTNDISPNDAWIIGYILSYIFPFASLAIEEFNLVICGIVGLLLLIALPIINSATPNPILLILGYHFYQISADNGISGYVLISKRKLRRKQDLRVIYRIFDYLLLDCKE